MQQAVIFINAAFVCYTAGVWAEKVQGRLRYWHTALFLLGIVCDALGTAAMGEVRQRTISGAVAATGYLSATFHSVTGMVALLLMVVHAVWALVVVNRRGERERRQFHRYSLRVWLLWLIPFISGAMGHFH